MFYIQRSFYALLLLVFPLAALSCQAAQQVPTANAAEDIEAVKAAVAGHWEAINSGDSTSNPHTRDITLILAEIEPRFVEGSSEMQQLGSSTTAWRIRDLQVQPLGNAAVATFYTDGSRTWADGRVDRRTRRVTEVWVKQGDVWEEAHHHDSVFAPLQ